MNRQLDRLRALANVIDGRVGSCNQFNANLGEAQYREAKGELRSYRVRIGETASRFSLELKGFETTVAFAVGEKDKICSMDRRLKSPTGLFKLAVYVSDSLAPEETRQWLKIPRNRLALQALACSSNEPLYVYRNGLAFLVKAERLSPDLVTRLVDLADCLPRPPADNTNGKLMIDGLVLDPTLLPDDLRVLVPHIQHWAVGDDADRQERILAAKRPQLAKLLKEVGPQLERIDKYLDSFGNNPLPDQAILLGQLAECVAELKASRLG